MVSVWGCIDRKSLEYSQHTKLGSLRAQRHFPDKQVGWLLRNNPRLFSIHTLCYMHVYITAHVHVHTQEEKLLFTHKIAIFIVPYHLRLVSVCCPFLSTQRTSFTPSLSTDILGQLLSWLSGPSFPHPMLKIITWHQQGSSVSKGACHQYWWVWSQRPLCGRRELSHASCPLIATCIPWRHMSAHTYQIKNATLKDLKLSFSAITMNHRLGGLNHRSLFSDSTKG